MIVLPREINPSTSALWAFDLPFPSRVSSERVHATAHAREWVQKMGLVTDEEALRRHDRIDPALWACMTYPDAVGEDLNLLADWPSWWALWDDMLDDPFGRDSERVQRFFDELIDVVKHPALSVASSPFMTAFADIWQRQRLGMSPTYQDRAAKNWVEYFRMFMTKSTNRWNRTVLTVEEYLKVRDVTGAVWLMLDFAERVGHYELSPSVLDSVPMKTMRLTTVRVIDITQDVQSLAKEEAAGDQHNMVLVMEREYSSTRQETLCQIHRMIREYTDNFLTAAAQMPRLLDDLGIHPEDRWPVYKHIAGMQAQMRGDVDWCATTLRYRSTAVEQGTSLPIHYYQENPTQVGQGTPKEPTWVNQGPKPPQKNQEPRVFANSG